MRHASMRQARNRFRGEPRERGIVHVQGPRSVHGNPSRWPQPGAGCRHAEPGHGTASSRVSSSRAAPRVAWPPQWPRRRAAQWCAAAPPCGIADGSLAVSRHGYGPPTRPGRLHQARIGRHLGRTPACSSALASAAAVPRPAAVARSRCASGPALRRNRSGSRRGSRSPAASSGGSRCPWKRPSRFQVVTPCRTSSRRRLTVRRRTGLRREPTGWLPPRR